MKSSLRRSTFLPVLVTLIGLMALSPVSAQKPKPKSKPVAALVVPAWKVAMDKALTAPALKHATVGVLVQSLDTGKVLYERNADAALVPASNQKLLTAAVALWKLGPEFRFRTPLYYTGKLDDNGNLFGDLYIKGVGDPSMTSERLLFLAQDLKTRGVTRIAGKIRADSSQFDDRFLGVGWQWDDEPFSYQPQVSALNCDGNTLAVEVRPGVSLGNPAKVVLGGDKAISLGFDKTLYLTVNNTVKTGGGGTDAKPQLVFDRVRAKNEVSVTGTIPLGAPSVIEAMTLENPALFTATRFCEVVALAGIRVSSPDKTVEEGMVPADAKQIVYSESVPMPSLLKEFLKPSDNLYGEAFLKAVGGADSGLPGTTDKGEKALRTLLAEAGVSAEGLSVADGSGLSRMNSVTPRLLVGLLSHVYKKFPAASKEAFIAALPEMGVDGTLRNRLKDTPAQGRVRAKTGTLSGVSSLSGYVTTRGGQHLAFSILMNHYDTAKGATPARAVQDAVALILTEL